MTAPIDLDALERKLAIPLALTWNELALETGSLIAELRASRKVVAVASRIVNRDGAWIMTYTDGSDLALALAELEALK